METESLTTDHHGGYGPNRTDKLIQSVIANKLDTCLIPFEL